MYEFTVDNPGVFTSRCTAAFPMARSEEHIYEYACHEGNHGLRKHADQRALRGEGGRRRGQEEVSHGEEFDLLW